MRTSSFLVTVVALVASACSSSSSTGTASISGTVASTTFTVASTVAVLVPSASTNCDVEPDGGTQCVTVSSGQVLAVVLTNRAVASCSTVLGDIATRSAANFSNLDSLALDVGTSSGDITPRTYPILTSQAEAAGTSGSTAGLTTTDGTCNQKLDTSATSGSVVITSISSTEVAGTYDVTFGTSGSFKGSFDVPICDLPDSGLSALGGSDAGKLACE